MSEKIKPQHVSRKAILYARQSSPSQVANNLESQKLQYAQVPPAGTIQRRIFPWLRRLALGLMPADIGLSISRPICSGMLLARRTA